MKYMRSFLRRIDRKWINAILALTVGLLVFLFVDTLLEALEIAETLPGAFQGTPLIIFGTLLSVGVLMSLGRRKDGSRSPLAIATLIALGIGLHNFGEGLAKRKPQGTWTSDKDRSVAGRPNLADKPRVAATVSGNGLLGSGT